MDEDGYPEEAELDALKTWHIRSQADLDALWEAARKLWSYPDRFVPTGGLPEDWPRVMRQADWYVSTGGWSGNEDVIGALQRNFIFWSFCWRATIAGGHYWFRIANAIRSR